MRIPGAVSRWVLAASCLLCVLGGASGAWVEAATPSSMQLTSSAFNQGQPIPAKYTCDAKDVSPSLQWSGVPSGAKSIVLLVNDPDAPVGDWVHWVLFDLPATATSLMEDLPKGQHLPGGGKQGLNDFKRLGYGGPCPPPGKPHRYFFRIYALDTLLELKPGTTRKEVQQAMQGHVLAQGELMGIYQRK